MKKTIKLLYFSWMSFLFFLFLIAVIGMSDGPDQQVAALP
jgi:hypothetical protein